MARKLKRVHKTLTPDESRQYKKLARKVDRDDREQIAEAARHLRARHERLREVLRLLQAERQRQGLTLDELASRTGIGKANLSRLENATDPNPTLATLQRYADALGREVVVSLSEKRAG